MRFYVTYIDLSGNTDTVVVVADSTSQEDVLAAFESKYAGEYKEITDMSRA